MLLNCTPGRAKELLAERSDCQLVDVREYAEYAQGHMPGARHIPLGEITRRMDELDRSRPIVVVCKSGGRAARAADMLIKAGCREVLSVDGGTDAWVSAGLPTESERNAPWSMERQVRIVAGALVIVGLFIPPWPILSAIVGVGLVFAALTNTCAMGRLLSKMPWNRPKCSGGINASSCSSC
ncbi:MAG: rhodanese-like domain-containing protein [Phycisphaerae bacterium]|nr:rhodanese-like domain-containing protein [Phycisphaerae bacterium]